jgi:hypothetical protein
VTRSLSLELVVDGAATPISGTITVPGLAPLAFVGWTDLFARLREVVDTQPASEAACASEY